MRECQKCHEQNDDKNNFCAYCGTPLWNICTNKKCPNYENHIYLEDDTVFCPNCGTESLFKIYGLVSSPLENDLPF